MDMLKPYKPFIDMSEVPLGRFGRPEDLADAVAYLLSDGASYVCRATLRVGGGRGPL